MVTTKVPILENGNTKIHQLLILNRSSPALPKLTYTVK